MGRRTLLLIAAVLLAAIGTSVLFLYVNSIADSGSGAGTPATALAPAEPISAGTRIREGVQLVEVPISEQARASGEFVTDPSQIVDRVSNRQLLAFQPLTKAQFGGPITTTTSVELAPGEMAVTVEVEDAGRLADLLRPGNEVAVWVLDPEARNRQDGGHEARLILDRVKIITIGSQSTIRQSTTTDGQTRTGSTALVTLQVDQPQAAEVMVASVAGEIRFTLLSGDAQTREQTYDDAVLEPTP